MIGTLYVGKGSSVEQKANQQARTLGGVRKKERVRERGCARPHMCVSLLGANELCTSLAKWMQMFGIFMMGSSMWSKR